MHHGVHPFFCAKIVVSRTENTVFIRLIVKKIVYMFVICFFGNIKPRVVKNSTIIQSYKK